VRLLEVYKPVAREGVNAAAGSAIDLAYGFILAAIFLLLYPALPGSSGVVKGLAFGGLTWFLRVVMPVAGQWIMFRMPAALPLYLLVTGFAQMTLIGALYGLLLRYHASGR
jgi:hypothetical protein